MIRGDGPARIPPPHLVLADLAADIEREHRLAIASACDAVAHAIAAGRLLLQAKRQIGHGGWLPWLAAKCPSVSIRSAQVYMRLAECAPSLTGPNTQRAAYFSLRAALRVIAQHRSAPALSTQEPFLNGHARHGAIHIHHGDCRALLPKLRRDGDIIVSDVPYNVGISYDGYNDCLPSDEYAGLIRAACQPPCVIISYPELMFRIAMIIGMEPSRAVAWVYHANTPRQWRLICWFGVEPDFARLRQPYRNPTDARVQELIANGSEGAASYDWWLIEQTKNVSAEKTCHLAQTPVEVMRRILMVTPALRYVDPFCGSGSLLVAAKELCRAAIGIEQSSAYCQIARQRLSAMPA